MTSSIESQDNTTSIFLVEPSKTSGVKTVAFNPWKKVDLAEKSEEAMNRAMKTIQNMAKTVNSAIDAIEGIDKPDEVEVEFGLKFDGELDIIIAKAGVEASIVVNFKWEKKDANKSIIQSNSKQ